MLKCGFCNAVPETPRRSYRKLLSSMIGDKLWDENGKDKRCMSRAITMPMRSPARPKEVSLALVPVKGCRHESPEVATGWPLLRKKFLPDRKASVPDKSKMSVVQWAMRLPGRYSAVSPVHSEYRTTRPDSTSASHVLRDRVVVPSRSNSGKSCVVIEELEKETPEELTLLKEKFSSIYSSFSYSELAKITSDFSQGVHIWFITPTSTCISVTSSFYRHNIVLTCQIGCFCRVCSWTRRH